MIVDGLNIAVVASLVLLPWALPAADSLYRPGPGDVPIPLTAPASSAPAGQDLPLSAARDPAATARRYTVQPGDVLWRIAAHFGVGIDVITQANGLGDDDLIAPGMELVIPYSNEVGTAQAGPTGPIVTGRGLHFVASITQSTCWLFHDSTVVRRWTCSPGRAESPSIPGNYTVQSRLQQAYSYPADAYMPYWLGIYDAAGFENGIHGLPFSVATGEKYWVGLVGTPITFGCVMLEDADARALFDVAYIGMPVTILP